ncbi:MAG: primosomal replication protein N [Betaproteobacteria bacterium]|nr:primosomal replication protein N [Betaproteobacteria bacterium]
MTNQLRISGRLIAREALRYTPAGIPVCTGVLEHRSEQEEDGGIRDVECEVPLIALGDTAKWLAAATPGLEMALTGFIAAKSKNRKTLVFHVQSIEFLEGKKNA